MNIPNKCYALNNMTINPKTKIGQVIEIRAFETGYYKTDKTATQEEVDTMNLAINVTLPEAKAMESASLFGWQVYKNCLETFKEKQ